MMVSCHDMTTLSNESDIGEDVRTHVRVDHFCYSLVCHLQILSEWCAADFHI